MIRRVMDSLLPWRARARGIDHGKRAGYNAGRMSRMDGDGIPPAIGPNAAADVTGDAALRRIRDFGRNHGVIRGAVTTIGNNTCGVDIIPVTEWDDLNEQLSARWEMMREGVDAGREHGLESLQRTWVNELVTAGEVLSHRPWVGAWRDFAAGPCIELIPAERMDLAFNGAIGGHGPRIRQSVEFDAAGRRVAYHVLRDHPSDGYFAGLPAAFGGTRRISAMDGTLSVLGHEAGLVRGVSLFIATAHLAKMLSSFADSALYQAVAAACLGVFIEGADDSSIVDPSKVETTTGVTDSKGNPILKLVPGMIGRLKRGAKPHILNANVPGPQFDAAIRVMTRLMGVGVGLGYSSMSRDYSGTTFSSQRAETLETRKLYEAIMRLMYQDLVRPYYRDCVRWWISQGYVTLRPEQSEAWRDEPLRVLRSDPKYPGWAWVDPRAEVEADAKARAEKFASRADICKRRGTDPYTVIDEELQLELYERDERARLGLLPARAEDGGSPGDENREPTTDDAGEPVAPGTPKPEPMEVA